MPDRRNQPIATSPPSVSASAPRGGRRQRIVVNANQCYTLVRFRGDLMRALVAAGHDVIVTLPDVPAELVEPLAALGVRVELVPIARSSVNPLHDLRYMHELRRLYRRLGPDIVFSIMVKPAVYGSLAARMAGVPRIVAMFTGLGYAFDAPRSPRQRIAALAARGLAKAAMRSVDRIVFHNSDDRDLFVTKGLATADRCRVVAGSGVDLEHFKPVPLPANPSFLVVARLLEAKGIREFIAASARVRAEFPGVRCMLAGPRDSSPDAVDPGLVAQALADGIIETLGEVGDVRTAISQALVVVLPSYREGRPRAVIEAMAMGRPIITTDVPGCRETVTDGINGILVPARDATRLADAMLTFCRDPALATTMGAASSAIANQHFDVRQVNDVMLSCILGGPVI